MRKIKISLKSLGVRLFEDETVWDYVRLCETKWEKVDFGRFEVKTQKMGYTRNEWSLTCMIFFFFFGKSLDPYESI